jgi:anthranilate phosphoribosyltransferase
MLTKETIIDLATANLPEHVIAEHLQALAVEQLTVQMLNDFVDAISSSAVQQIFLDARALNLVDCCGTGGSGLHHFNTSTTVAFILAAGGVNVAKFGNRGATSPSGSFDFLEALGIRALVDAKTHEDVFAQTNLCFLFAPQFYPGLAKLAPIRRALGVQTIFNFVGPLLNPARPQVRLLGTGNWHMHSLLGQFFVEHRFKGCVVRADSGLDELDPSSTNSLLYADQGVLSEQTLEFRDQNEAPRSALTAHENVELFTLLIDDFDHAPGYFQRLVTLNSALGFSLSGAARDMTEGERLSVDLLRSGAVKEKFQQVVKAYAGQDRYV